MLKAIATIVVVLVLLGVGGFFYLGQQSKSGSAPGLVSGALAPCPDTPNCASSEEDTAQDKRVDPLPRHDWDALPVTLEAMGARVIVQSDDYIATEFTSAIFGFVDDLELRKGEDAVHIRSASRVGY